MRLTPYSLSRGALYLPPTLHHGVLTLAPRFFISGRATASQHRSSCRGGQCATAVSSSWGESYLSSLPPLVHAAGHRGQTTHPLKSLAMQRHVLEAGGIVDNPAPFPLLQLGVVYQESIQHAALNAADAKRAKLLLFSDEQAQVRSPCLFSSSPNPVVPSRPTLGAEAVCGQGTVHKHVYQHYGRVSALGPLAGASSLVRLQGPVSLRMRAQRRGNKGWLRGSS